METVLIILGIIGIIVLMIFITIEGIKEKSDWQWVLKIFSLIFVIYGIMAFSDRESTKYTSIECHKGNNPYEMKVLYDENQCPVDTLYIKK